MTVQKIVKIACVTKQMEHVSINAIKDSTASIVIIHAVQIASIKVISVSLKMEPVLLRNVQYPGMVLSVKIDAPGTV